MGRRRVLVAVALGVFCLQLDAFALNTALPGIGRSLHVTHGGLRWLVAAYLLAAGTMMLGAGRLGDLYGRRRLLLTGLAAFGSASLACALAPSLPFLVVARVVQGGGGALAMPTGLALLTNAYPPSLRGRAVGLALGGGGVATVCGPFLGGALAEVSWRLVFWVNIPLAILAAACARRAGESRGVAGPLDRKGLVAGTAALVALAVFADRLPVWRPDRSAALFVLFAALAAVFVRTERRAPNPLVSAALFRDRAYVALTAAGAMANAATVVFLVDTPLSLQASWGLSSGASGAVFLAPATLMAIAAPAAGRVPARRAVAVMAGALGVSAALLWAATLAPTLPAYAVAITACGASLGLGNALTLTATQAAVRPERAGEAAGVTKTVITVAAGFGVVLAGTSGLLAASAGCLGTAAVLALWPRRARTPGGVGRMPPAVRRRPFSRWGD